MYDIVIVDDEPSIREGLAQLLDWESLGFTIAGAAANGKEALRLYADIRPDLMIVDIRMPGMDGMALIRELKMREADVRVLVLSGYADFEYARQAIALGVDNYLLKPVDEDELTEYLGVIKQSLDAAAAKRGLEQRTARRLRGERITAMLSGERTGAGAWESELASWGLSAEGYRIVLIEIRGQDGEAAHAQGLIADRLAETYEKAGSAVVFRAGSQVGLLFGESRLRDSERRKLMTALGEWSERLGCSVFAAAGDGVAAAADIPRSYGTAKQRLQRRFFYDGADFIDEETAGRLPAPSTRPIDPESLLPLTEQLYLTVSSGNVFSVAPLVEEIGERLLSGGEGEASLKARFVQLLTRLLEKLSVRDAAARDASAAYDKKLLEINEARGYDSMLTQISGLLADLARRADDGGGERQIQKMKQLIDSHYPDNLKLEKLAAAFNYNSAYLGKLFKTVTGDSFNTYLDKVRISRAKQLLQAGFKVYEVAERVGYTNPDYFHAKFRKYEGLSPTAYRGMCESSEVTSNKDG